MLYQKHHIMKKLVALFKSLFNQKQNKMEQTTQEVLVNPYSQPHVLQQRMREEKLTHGETVRADLSPVRLEHYPESGKTYMYFCPMQLIDVVEKVSPGDGESLPAEATLKGIVIDKSLKPGLYTLKNVTIFSNGTLQVIANEDTKFEPFESKSIPAMSRREAPRYTSETFEQVYNSMIRQYPEAPITDRALDQHR